MDFLDLVRDAGVVGAGGAGFPTHIKLNAKADTVIANAAECEPLLQTDMYALKTHTVKTITGLDAVMRQVKATKGFIAIKRKHKEIIGILEKNIARYENIQIFILDDFYPAGDEHILVNLVTGRTVPEGGIPLNIGAVVNNICTLINIYNALNGIPVTERILTVTGEVNNPVTLSLPIGTSIEEAISIAGGAAIPSYKVIVGGPMMGYVEDNLKNPIIKTTSGIIVLSADHKLVKLKSQDMRISINKGRSNCCQCMQCTEMCPRYLLGHNIRPHKTMRVFSGSFENVGDDMASAFLCSECGLCGLYACVHEIMPFKIHNHMKKELSKNNLKYKKDSGVLETQRDYQIRRIPVERLVQRLDLSKYNKKTTYSAHSYSPGRIVVPLKQHTGVPAHPVLKVGDVVAKGQVIARIGEKELGSDIHAGISGKITCINESIFIDSVQEGNR